jgi:hypothetical protein
MTPSAGSVQLPWSHGKKVATVKFAVSSNLSTHPSMLPTNLLNFHKRVLEQA